LNHFSNWTVVLIVLCIVAFVFQNITNSWIYLAFFPGMALSAPWIFVTSIFLHADLSHLFFNMIALFFFGTSLERMIGGRAFVTLFFLSGIIGNLGYLLTSTDPYTPAIGASGAIYGVMGALATLAPFMLVYIYGLLPLPMIAAAVLWGILDFAGLFGPSGIAHGAHLGGLFVGFFFGLYQRMLSARTRTWQIHYQY
jgi:membrane associated rhomboid family serine protease